MLNLNERVRDNLVVPPPDASAAPYGTPAAAVAPGIAPVPLSWKGLQPRQAGSPPQDALQTLFLSLRQFADRRQAKLEALPRSVAFLARYGIPPALLRRMAERANQIGAPALACLFADGILDETRYLDLLADETGLRRVGSPLRLEPDQEIAEVIRSRMAVARSPDGAKSFVIVPSIGTIERIIAQGQPHFADHVILASEAEFQSLLLDGLRQETLREASCGALERSSVRSARQSASAGQVRLFAFLILVAPMLLIFLTPTMLSAMIVGLCVVFIAHAILKIMAMAAHQQGLAPGLQLTDEDLPNYAVIVPLYREPRVVPQLVQALKALRYPREKLDIKLVLEASDRATLLAIQREALPSYMSVLIAPPGDIQTKPRALNIALLFARGDLVTIFDAEDEPEPDQLLKAAACFARHPEIDCLQASLAPDNAADGPLQALFTLEYAGLFDVVQPGLSALDLPNPLGGTSNHFRRSILERSGGWDAFNVTEDAELGLRLWQRRVRIGKLQSTTYEEAPPRLGAWFNQRRRWTKGWLQTAIAQTAYPVRAMRDFGVYRFCLSAFTMVATLLSMLIYPFGSLAFAIKLSAGLPFFLGDFVSITLDVLTVGVVALGLVVMVVPPIIGIAKRRLWRFAPYLVLLPVYHLAVSVASWVALYDLCTAPFHWLKTDHGFARTSLRKVPAREKAPKRLLADIPAAIRSR